MPNWTTDETGESRFNLLECKRCLQDFEPVKGEIPEHKCLGGIYKSESKNGEYYKPVRVR